MAEHDRPLAVLGATGYTGKLVVEEARKLGLPLRLVGRRREALEALAREGEEVRVADAQEVESLVRAFDGAFAVASAAGPFMEVGFAPLSTAIAAGAHYLDTSGEFAFSRRVYDDFGPEAERRGLVLLTAFGFDYVPGDLAARIAAEELEEPVVEIAVAYSAKNAKPSAGTVRTIGSLMSARHAAWVGGELVPSAFGATARRMRFPFGERSVVEWGGTEPLTVPRHTHVHEVRSYFRTVRPPSWSLPLARAGAPLLRAAARFFSGPDAEARAKAEFAVVAEARSAAGARRATIVGRDVYGLTALLIARAAEALRAGEARGAGALAPAEAFDARTLLARLEPLARLDSVEPLEVT